MGTIRCAKCGANEDEASASFGEEGLICARCHSGEVSKDAAQMQAALDDASRAFQRDPLDPRNTSGRSGLRIDIVSQQKTVADARAPSTPLHDELTARGLTVSRRAVSTSVDTPLGSKRTEGFVETWTLPNAPAVQASFAPEGLGKKLAKLFSKELQTGDGPFDAAVYIRTDTTDATRAFLEDAEVRGLIADIVARGGKLRVDGLTVEGHVSWRDDDPAPPAQDVVARVVRAVAP